MRSLKVPGSDSSALQMMYFWSAFTVAAPSPLMPVGKAAPPRPTSPEAFSSATMSSGFIVSAFSRAKYFPYSASEVVP